MACRATDAEGMTIGSQDDEPADSAAPAPGVVEVIPLIPIEDAIQTFISNRRLSFARSGGISVRSRGSTMSSQNATVRSCGIGSLRNMLCGVLEAPPHLIIPRDRLRLRRADVLGQGAYGLVVRGELHAATTAAATVTAVTATAASATAAVTAEARGVLSETAHTQILSGDASCILSPTTSDSESESGSGSGTPSGTTSTLEPSGEVGSERLSPVPFNPMPPARNTDPLAESFGPSAADAARGCATVLMAEGPRTTLVDDHVLFAMRAARAVESHHSEPISCYSLPPSYASQMSRSSCDTPHPVAVKLIDKARLSRRRQFVSSFQMELRFAATLRHPSIIAVHGVMEEDAELLLVMDVAEGGSLKEYMRQQGLEGMREMAPRLLADIVLGLEYLVSLGIAHRDIKPDNILLTADHHARLADFGTACYLGDAETNKFGGTAAYMSPEVVETGRATATSDLWALGCVLYELFVGRSPFQGETSMLVMRKIKQFCCGALEYPPYFPADARDLVERLIRRDPNERLTSAQTGGFPALKAHAFFTGIDWSGGSAKPIAQQVDYTAQIRDALDADEQVLHSAIVLKRSTGFLPTKRRRLLVLTDRPRLFYIDPDTLQVRKSFPITGDVYAEVESPAQFRVVTPKAAGGRTYVFHDPTERAGLWGMRINGCVKQKGLAGSLNALPVLQPRPRSGGSNGKDGCGSPLAQSASNAWGIRRLFGAKVKNGEAT